MTADPQNEFTLKEAAEYTGKSELTLRRYIYDGRLAAVMHCGKYRITRGDLDAAVGPAPVLPGGGGVTDGGLRAWAERMAAMAPPMSPEQRGLAVTAFESALKTAA